MPNNIVPQDSKHSISHLTQKSESCYKPTQKLKLPKYSLLTENGMQHLIKHGSVKTKHRLNALLQSPAALYATYTQMNHDYIIMCFTAHPFLVIYFIPATISADSRHFLFEQNTHDLLVKRSSARVQHTDPCKLRPARQLNRTSPCAGILYPPRATPPSSDQ